MTSADNDSVARFVSEIFAPWLGEFMRIAEQAVELSGGELRLVRHGSFISGVGHGMKLRERPLGRHLESYVSMGLNESWRQALELFHREMVEPLRKPLPDSHAAARSMLIGLASRTLLPDDFTSFEQSVFLP